MRVEIEDGKYTYIFKDGHSEILRYGEYWRDCVGDKFIYCMASEVESLRQQLLLSEHRYSVIKAMSEGLAGICDELRQQLAECKKDAERWRELVSLNKFNNVQSVGFAINRAKENVEKQNAET